MSKLSNEIMEAYLFLREHNHTISSETLEFIKEVSLLCAEESVVRKADATIHRNGIGHISAFVGLTNSINLNGKTATVIIIPNN